MSSSFLTASQREEFAPGQRGNPNTPWCCPPTEMRLKTFTVGQRCTRARLGGGREGRESKRWEEEGKGGRMKQERRERGEGIKEVGRGGERGKDEAGKEGERGRNQRGGKRRGKGEG